MGSNWMARCVNSLDFRSFWIPGQCDRGIIYDPVPGLYYHAPHLVLILSGFSERRVTSSTLILLFPLVEILATDNLNFNLGERLMQQEYKNLRNTKDLSGLLLIYYSLGDAEGIQALASLAKEQQPDS